LAGAAKPRRTVLRWRRVRGNYTCGRPQKIRERERERERRGEEEEVRQCRQEIMMPRGHVAT